MSVLCIFWNVIYLGSGKWVLGWRQCCNRSTEVNYRWFEEIKLIQMNQVRYRFERLLYLYIICQDNDVFGMISHHLHLMMTGASVHLHYWYHLLISHFEQVLVYVVLHTIAYFKFRHQVPIHDQLVRHQADWPVWLCRVANSMGQRILFSPMVSHQYVEHAFCRIFCIALH